MPPRLYCYDNANKPTQITQGTCQTPQAPTVSFTYDNANRRASLTLPNGIVATYGYDAASRVTSITYTQGSATVGNLTYTYDANGRRTNIGGGLAGVNLPAATTSSGVYNVNNQLTSWNGTTLSYDLNGNMINDGSRSYSWNARNQLSSIGATTFAYDGSLRRSQNGAGVSFVYDGLNPVQEIVGGSVRANLVTGGLDEYFGRTDSGGTSSFVTDALGSTLALTDSTGAVKTQYTYEPFGNTTSSGTSSTNAFEYAGRENDGSGMYYYRARYYSASLQRFIGEDPLDFGGGDANLYVYVGNDPLDDDDPFGLIKSSHCDLFGVCSTDPWPKLGKRYSTDPNKGGVRTPSYCLGKALEAKGISIVLDVVGAIPGLGNMVSATTAGARAVNDIATFGGGIAGVGMALPDATPYGAASGAAGLGLGLADVAVGGSKVIPVIGTFVSTGAGIYDIYGGIKAYQRCMAGG